MALDGKILHRALERLEQDNRRRAQQTRLLRQEIYRKDPRIQVLDAELQATVAETLALALRHGQDPSGAVTRLQNRNLQAQAERKQRIRQLGYPDGCIDDLPRCSLCGDTGYIRQNPCSCLMELYREEQRKELSRLLDLQGERFEAFRLEYYNDGSDAGGISPRQHMHMVYQVCRRYAETFRPGSGSLFLTGAPGLGKTFLSSCIAGTVSERGFSVVYDTAVSLVSCFEDARFGRGERQEEAEADVKRYLGCDLLILDDLGAEMVTSLTVSAIYEVLNTRLREGKSMVVSSNLSIGEAGKRYSTQIASRLSGGFEELRFYGSDIRQQKKLGRL